MANLREDEINYCLLAVKVKSQSLLVLGDDGSGKSEIAQAVADDLRGDGYLVAISEYGGSAKRTYVDIADQLGVDTLSSKGKELTADQLRDAIAPVLTGQISTCNSVGVCIKPILICDNAHRYPASMRYWLEDISGLGAILLLLATKPPRKDIFLKMPRISLKPLSSEKIRELMLAEAQGLGVQVDTSKLAKLQERSGGNPHLAKRVIHEEALGIGDEQAGDHVEYIDGTPFLIASISFVGIVRLIGLGMGDKSLYIIGGIATITAITLRILLSRANARTARL